MSSASGAPDELWELLEKYRADLVAQALAILNSREDSEDAVQETFIEVARDPRKLPRTGLGAWLKAINRRNAVDRLRVKRSDSRRIELKAQRDPEDTFTTGGFSKLELHDSLDAAIETLPENLKTIVKLRYFEQLSYKEISERLKVPVGTVNWMLMDAFAALFARLKDQMPTARPAPGDDAETQNNSPVQ